MKYACISLLVICGLPAFANTIDYVCDGGYDSHTVYDPYDPATVSVNAHVQASMSSKPNSKGEYTLKSAKLSLTAVNNHSLDAGSMGAQNIKGAIDDAHKDKFKDYIRFDLGMKLGVAYPDDGNIPETYLLIPAKTKKTVVVYIQRTGSGHDSYPTIRLLCK